MDSRQAREILMLYRPGRTGADEPQMVEALEQARRDPELAAWLERHSTNYFAIRDKLKAIPVPAGLDRRIIAGQKKQSASPFAQQRQYLAAAAAVLILGVIGWWMSNRSPDETTLSHFRNRMVSTVLRDTYGMGITTTNQAQIREYFRERGAQTDYVISTNLERLPGIGGSVYMFNNHPVDLLCLYDGVDAAGNTNKLWIFVADKSSIPDSPKPGKVEFAPVNTLQTASWTTGNKVYLLAATGTRKTLENYLK